MYERYLEWKWFVARGKLDIERITSPTEISTWNIGVTTWVLPIRKQCPHRKESAIRNLTGSKTIPKVI